MTKKPLHALFDAMFHGKQSFDEFLHLPVGDGLQIHSFHQGGKDRQVVSPSEKMRAYQNFLRLFVVDFLPLREDIVFSYRRGVSARDALLIHAQSRHFFTSDISHFFPSLSRNIVRRTIEAALDRLPISDLDKHLERMLDMLCFGGALPIGFLTSPGVSNSVLYPFDTAVANHCEGAGLAYSRFADDLILSGLHPAEVARVGDVVAKLLGSCFSDALQLNSKKTKFLHPGDKVKLLGMQLLPNGLITIDSPAKQEIETMLHFYLRARARFVALNGETSHKNEARLSGLLNYANSVDKDYLDKLRRKYGAAVVDFFLHRSFG